MNFRDENPCGCAGRPQQDRCKPCRDDGNTEDRPLLKLQKLVEAAEKQAGVFQAPPKRSPSENGTPA
jgi:hypothetical protein